MPRAKRASTRTPKTAGRWLVLGGGGLKGLGHVGAWRALMEAEVEIEGIVGTSIGGLVAVCLAAGMDWRELQGHARALRRPDILRINRRIKWLGGVRERSVYKGDPLLEYVSELLPISEWSEIPLPVQVSAVALGTGETHWFGMGARTDVSPAEAIYASCALPLIYPPAQLGDDYFVDGGTGQALPLQRAADLGATSIIAVDAGAGIESDPQEAVNHGMVGIHQRVYGLMMAHDRRHIIDSWTEPPLLCVRPEVDEHGTFDFAEIGFYLEEGYRAMRSALQSDGT